MLMAACASIGRPEGGPRDETPPVYLRSNPAMGAVNVNPSRVEIYFDENVKVEDVINKVVMSPAQKQMPSVTANGRRLSVQFRDTLIPNTTYTIDFSDAIRDLNEGNILDGFAIDFSTGPTRDSLIIAGRLFQASNLEPAQGMLVGVHSNLADSALTTIPLDRIAKTNQRGEFIIRNLPEGSYQLFALNDLNRDYRWDRSEDVAFYDSVIIPTVENIMVADTLQSIAGADSIVSRPGSRYAPANLLLTWFNENYKAQYLQSYTRPDSMKIHLEMGAPSDTLPQLTILNGSLKGSNLNDHALLDRTALNDTLTYWITAPELTAQDTILMATRYLRTDSLNSLSWTTDTLKFTYRAKTAKKVDPKKIAANSDSVSAPKTRTFNINVNSKNTLDLHRPLSLSVSEPIATIDSTLISLEIKQDTVWHKLTNFTFGRDSLHHLLDYSLHSPWIGGERYRFTADSAAMVTIYGAVNKPLSQEFTVKPPEDYATLSFTIPQASDSIPVVVQLLNAQDVPVASAPAISGTATFTFVEPGTYYARAFIDLNRNGIWDTGNIASHTQPEEVNYYPKKLNIKKNWEITQAWDLYELPVDKQKPREITKNKPKTKEGDPATDTDEDEEYDESEIDPFTGRPYNSDAYGRGSNNSRNSNSGRNSGSAQTFQRL